MKKILILLLFCLAATGIEAQLLWKISGDGLQKPSFVLGTHHAAPLSILDSIKGLQAAMGGCRQIIGEMDMADMNVIQAKLTQYIIAPADSTLDALYQPDDYRIIGDAVHRYCGIDVSMVRTIKPAALSATIEVMVAAKSIAGFRQDEQLDSTIQGRARAMGLTVKGFETPEFQFDLLFNGSLKEQAADLLKMVKDSAKFERYFMKIYDLYMAQDIYGMERLMEDPELGSSEAELAKLVYDRNARWAAQLRTEMATLPTLVVVGAGHLPGKKGLLSLLQAMGYTVEPVR